MKGFYKIWTNSNDIYNRCKCCTILSSFVVWVTIFCLMLFPVFGIGLSFFAMCFLCIGFKKNVLDCVQKKQVKVEAVFNYFKNSLTCFCLKICSLLLTVLWSLLLIIPGIVAALNYSFAPYIFSENPNMGTIECLEASKKMVYGRRSELFLIYLTEFLLIVFFLLFFSCLVIILEYILIIPLWLKILIPVSISVILFLIFVRPYFEVLLANMYIDVKNLEKKTSKQKSVKSVSKV
ncbi:MAG: hypothetical protein J6Q51_03075 [Clostridia bacterium]|nr:hypothetical protein [Clostridia bacterium]